MYVIDDFNKLKGMSSQMLSIDLYAGVNIKYYSTLAKCILFYIKYEIVRNQEKRIISRALSDKTGSVMTQKNFIIFFVT